MPKRWFMTGLVAAMIATLASATLVAFAAPSSQDAGGGTDAQPRGERPGARLPGAASQSLVGWINQSLASAPFWGQFDRFLGAEYRFLGPEDAPTTAVANPGTVIETGDEFVIIDANDDTGPQRYDFESPLAPPIQQVLGRLESGGNVIVVTVDGVARWLVVARQLCQEDGSLQLPFGQQGRPDGQAPPEGQGRFGQGGRFGQQDRPDGQAPPEGQGRFGQGGRFGQQDRPDGQAPPDGQGRFEGFQRPGQSDAVQISEQFVRCVTPDGADGQGAFEGFRRPGQADRDGTDSQGRFGQQGQDGESGQARPRSLFGRGGDGDEFRQRLLDRIQELRSSVSALFEDDDD